MNNNAEIILTNGHIYTIDKTFSTASAVAVGNGKIMCVGSDDEVKKYLGNRTKNIDLKGHTVLPGIIESHMHMQAYGLKLLNIDCFGKTKAEILNEVKAAYKSIRQGQWITGAGWNETGWEDKQLPVKQELDEIAPDVPIYIARVCGHLAWVNSAALAAAGINESTTEPAGGEIHRDAAGNATGILVDTAASLVQDRIPAIEEAMLEKAYMLAQDDFLKHGITSIHDLALSSLYDYGTVEFISGMYRKGVMKISINSYISADNAERAYTVGPIAGAFGGKYSMKGVKVFTDGSLGARSAWMLEEYSDRPGHFGNCRYTDGELYDLMAAARKNGFQIATHAIGDAANRQVISAYERILRDFPEPADHRSRIEHAQIIKRDDVKRLLALGIIPSMQFVHCTSDKEMTEERIGAERLGDAFPWRSFIDGGAIIPGGADAPVELVSPFHGIYAAVTRKDRSGRPEGGWRPEQKITRAEAIKAFTIWGAYAAFEEGIKGSIEAGKIADFTIIDRDVMNCPEDEIKDISVIATILGGETAYDIDGSFS